MSERFEKIVNAPHRAFGRATKRIQEIKPASVMGKVARGAGMGLTGLSQFLLWAAKYISLDNHVTRAGERALSQIKVGKNKKGQDKKLQSFAKKYPNLSSHILYYMMLAMVAGGVKGYNALTASRDDEKSLDSVELTLDMENQLTVEPNTYGAYLARVQPITPYLIADLIAKEGVHVDSTTGLHTPYLDSKGIPTIGFGSTVLMDGSSVKMNTPPITSEQAYELARWHLIEETFFIMYCYDIAIDKIDVNTTQEALSLGSMMYNAASKLIEDKNNRNHRERFARLRDDFKQYGYALPDSVVIQRFNEFPVSSNESFGNAWMRGATKEVMADKLGNYLAGGAGLQWRRWIEAGLMTGDIMPQMLLDCPVNGIYEFYECMGRKKDKFFTGRAPNRHVNRATYAVFKEWLNNPVNKKGESLSGWKKVRDYLPSDVVTACQHGQCNLGNSNVIDVIPQTPVALAVDMYMTDYESQYKDAVATFRKQEYTKAAQMFEALLKDRPDNALLHNDIAATYNKLGRYNDAIAHARQIIFEIGDKKQYAAAYYNAGFAYEHQGNLQKALANYRLSVANGNRRVQRDVTRLSNQLQKGNSPVKKQSKKSKRTAFNTGSDKVQRTQNSFIRKLNIQNNNTNNMA